MSLPATKIEIGFAPILRFFVVLLLLVFAFLIRDILAIIFIAFLIASGFNPYVDFLNRKGIPRIVAVALIYFTLIGLLVVFALMIKNTLVSDLSSFYQQVQSGQFNANFLGFNVDTKSLLDQINAALNKVELGGFISGARKFLSGVTGFLVIFVLAFYMLLEKNGLKQSLSAFVPLNIYEHVLHLIRRVEEKLGHWLRGELILMISIGVLTYILLKILNMPYAGVLAIIAGITEIIPGVGPIFAGFIGVVVSVVVFPFEPVRWLIVGLGYTLIQQFENHVLVPQVMKKALGLSPIVILTSLLIGAQLFGVVGAFMAVPAAAALSVIVQEWETGLKKATKRSAAQGNG